MATKQINQLTAATAIEDTDSIPLQTLAGITKKFTPAELKTNLDGRYQQKGTVIWEDTPATTVTGIELTSAYVYDIYISSLLTSLYSSDGGTLILRVKKPAGETEINVFYNYYSELETDKIVGILNYSLLSEEMTAPTDIYKIIRYEV